MTKNDAADPPIQSKLKSFTDLIPMTALDRHKHELQILEALMGQAVRDKDWPNVLKIFNEAHNMLKRIPAK